jgi:hypothetical protein
VTTTTKFWKFNYRWNSQSTSSSCNDCLPEVFFSQANHRNSISSPKFVPSLKAIRVGTTFISRESQRGLFSSDRSTLNTFAWELSSDFRRWKDFRQKGHHSV